MPLSDHLAEHLRGGRADGSVHTDRDDAGSHADAQGDKQSGMTHVALLLIGH